MRMLVLTLADSGLELVPKSLWSIDSVKKVASRRGKKPGEMILDISLHYSAMRKLKDWRKRGRPDILHVCLLVALGSLLNRMGLMDTVIHTYEGKVVFLDPSERIPRNFTRFIGLMEQLLILGKVPPHASEPLMWVTSHNLKSALEEKGVDHVFLLSEKGEKNTPSVLAEKIVAFEKPAVIIGAFQSGEFSPEVVNVADEVVSLGKISLDAWNVVARIISSIEDVLGVYEGV